MFLFDPLGLGVGGLFGPSLRPVSKEESKDANRDNFLLLAVLVAALLFAVCAWAIVSSIPSGKQARPLLDSAPADVNRR